MKRFLSLLHLTFCHAMVALLLLTPTTQAGDLLRMNASAGGGSAAVPGAAGAADANAINTAAAAALARANANDMLARNTNALQAVTAMQDAARAVAGVMNNAGANPNFPGTTLPIVPDGIGPGALDLNSASGAIVPATHSMENARAIVRIQQTQQQAMLEWNTFNVGRETTVRFDQSAGGTAASTWIAFNRVTDPTGNPTQILGSIEAQGQVYIINQNGIIFGGASQVNTGSMVASALPINDNLVARGLLNNPDSEFLFSSPDVPATVTAYGKIGNVTVQTGAKITAPTSSANVGGRVALIGPNVTNNGTISTPDGQTVLAAGMQVGFDAHSSDDPSLRGLDVYVGSVGSYGGTATNAGLIEAPRGSVVIAGKNVNQNGFINSTTSVALNGRIDLLANYNAIPNTNYNAANAVFGPPFVYSSGNSTGIVSTGANSVMQILPEWSSSATINGTELALKSQINMQGLGIYLGAGSVIHAPSANVVLSAGIWDLILRSGFTDLDFAQVGGQVYLDQGAMIDVSGSTAIAASISEYILTVDLRGAELADSALQRTGSLRGQSVTVDLRKHGVRENGTSWVGTPLANLTAYLGVIQRTVGQLTVAGGSVTMKAGESVVVRDNALINVSGGYQDFETGYVATTRLLHEGNLVDIADAREDILYDGIYNPVTSESDPRWGSLTGSTALFATAGHVENAHSLGANGGSLQIAAAAMALDGNFQGRTIIGPQQIEAAPQQSQLNLYFRAQQLSRAPLELPFHSPTPPTVEFSASGSTLSAADAFVLNGGGVPVALRQERRDQVILATQLLTTQGFGALLVDNSDGNVIVPAGLRLIAPTAGRITLLGADINVQGTIQAPGGSINLTAYNISPYTTAVLAAQGVLAVLPNADPVRGRVRVGAGALLDVAALVIDDRAAAAAPFSVPLEVGTVSTIKGGSINISAFTAEFAAGSVLDVSGGLVVRDAGRATAITYGDAGRVTLLAGKDPLLGSLLGGHLLLNGTLRGFSGATGGGLVLQAPTIQIGGVATFPNTLLLASEFFNNGGFASFSLTGLGMDLTPPGGAENFAPAIVISPGVSIRPQVSSLQATVDPASGTGPIRLATLLKPEAYRVAASLDFQAPGINNFADGLLEVRGSILMGVGSLIETDALGKITLRGQTVEVLGTLNAPAGAVVVSGALQFPENTIPATAFATVHLGAASRLSTAGKTVLLENAYGKREGHVYSGGSILVEGNLVADAGAVLDVSGTTSVLDLLPQQAGTASVFTAGLTMAALFPGSGLTQPVQAAQTVATQIDSAGGSITLQGGDFLFSNATLFGAAGGSTAPGGNLTVRSDRFIVPGTNDDAKDITLRVAQNMAQFTQPVFGASVIGSALLNGTGGAIEGIGYFGVDSFANGGFDALTLAGNVSFTGAVNLTAAGYLKVADGGLLAANDLVRLTATYVTLGQALTQPTRDEELINPYLLSVPGVGEFPSVFSPTAGTGRLEVTADLIETGFLSLQNIGQAHLTARQDLRGNGYFDIAGNLTITAGQVYPTTASTFTITAYNNSTVTILSSGGTPALPLAGGGRLNIFAANITQGGTLRAPLGTIRLGWDGTGAAPKGLVTNADAPVAQQITLTSGSITAVSALDSQTGAGVRIPYGLIKDGTNWIDPTGFDITSTGAPDKTIRISASNVNTATGSSIDLRGGGELYGYRWVEGNGGTNDILDTDGSYAILPGYSPFFAPYSPFATVGLNAGNLGGDKGYANATLAVGDRIFLNAATGLTAGVYTLLPARYALLPGALLVTPDTTGALTAAQLKPGGALLTSGYRFNSLNSAATSRIYQQFEVAPLSVVKARAEYTDYTAQTFIPAAQQRLNLPVTRTALDAGYALLGALQGMQLNGGLLAAGAQTGRGGRVDVSSPVDIVIAAPGAALQPGKLVLDATLLSGWQAESLLIGGERVFGTSSTTVTTRTDELTVDNAGAPLSGAEIILLAKETLTLAANAVITQSGTQTAADALVIGGNGALVRVSGVAAAQTSRSGVTASALPHLNVAAGAQFSGASITLDSTNATTLNNSAVLTGSAINLNSGRVSLLLSNPGALQPGDGLVLGGTVLTGLQTTSALSLLSYTSIDLYGTGTFANSGTLALHAAEIRGFNNGGSTVNLQAQSVLLDNSANGTLVGAVAGMSGELNVTATTITIGQNALVVDQFATVTLNAAGGILMQGAGAFRAQGDLNAVTPFFTASSSASQRFAAGGALQLTKPGGAQPTPTSLGLGAQVAFEGASIMAATDVLMPSGLIAMRALTGALSVSGRLDAGGVAQVFFDVTRFTDAGQITLAADLGNVTLSAASTLNVASATGGGAAGLLSISAAAGLLTLDGTLLGQGGAAVELDVGSLASFTDLNTTLNGGAFTRSRSLRVRSGDVTIDGTVNAQRFLLGVDQGFITVNGTINAAGPTGGRIDLIAKGNVTLSAGSLLTVAAQDFDSSGKGGAVTLESGAQRNGVVGTGRVDIKTGSTINLSVATANASSSQRGQFTGTLHLRAPQTTAVDNFILINPLNGTIINPSSIVIEGYKLYDFNQSNVVIQGGAAGLTNLAGVTLKTDAVTPGQSLKSDATAFMNNYSTMLNLLVGGNAGIQALESQGPGVVVLAPGIEISNRGGNITLGVVNTSSSQGSGAAYDWDLAGFRFGPKSAAGILTMRAAGNLEFYNTLSDGFNASAATSTNALDKQWTAPLLAFENKLPANTQSWSFRLAAGADFAAANFRSAVPFVTKAGVGSGNLMTIDNTAGIVIGQAVSGLNIPTGAVVTAINGNQVTLSQNVTAAVPANTPVTFGSSLLLGKDAGQARTSGATGANALTATAIRANTATNATTQSNRFQVIRTGTGNIEIHTGLDVQLLNQFATIYTAGAPVPDAEKVVTTGDFELPNVTLPSGEAPDQGITIAGLGVVQQLYPAQYSMAGGNVSINAQGSIIHLTRNTAGSLVADSSRSLPNNWLMRRGYVNPDTGSYGEISVFQSFTRQIKDESASTTWWVNFSNFFDGVGALGGGNVLLQAGQNVENVSAHAPTNARAASGAPDPAKFLELGGGDVTVLAGRNIDGGIYYVERGTGTLSAGGAITTNATRSPSLGMLSATPVYDDASTWLPTTLFVGQSRFEVKARGDLLLGPVANTFLLPQGLTNRHWYKTYFSTFSTTSAVSAVSLGGSVTLRQAATLVDSTAPQPLLSIWLRKQLLLNSSSAANFQPWLRMVETQVAPFDVYATLLPSSVYATSFSGDVLVSGGFNLAPSPSGTLELLAAGGIHGLHKTGTSRTILNGSQTEVWASSKLNLSDTSLSSLPGISAPYAYFEFLGGSTNNTLARTTNLTFLNLRNAAFLETGSTSGSFAVVQAKQTLHAAGILHLNDTSPVRLYAAGGDLSGLALFSAKSARVLAQRDLTDIDLYLQNVRDSDISVVSSGRDIVAYNANSALRTQAVATGRLPAFGETPKSGDIQISGPGTLQVLAGRDLNLGTGSNNADGTGVGVTSIGNGRNPYLPFAGADVIIGAGLGEVAASLGSSQLDFDQLITDFNTPRNLADLAELLGVNSVDLKDPALTAEQQKKLALGLFYVALRNAGRDRNDPESPDVGTYAAGYAAIDAFIPSSIGTGSIQTQARDIRTRSGGDISILAPNGGLQLAASLIGETLAPPGIITEAGGGISIFTHDDVSIGISRIFTLRGGDITIWSSIGDIAAGSSSKTVQSAPPTRVLIDPQSASVATDLAGLATGGGIGVLATVAGVAPGNVDLIAPIGAVDAGDAGIRATGNLNIAASIVLNAGNIAVGGASAGTPAAPAVASPSLGGLASAASAGAATTSTATNQSEQQNQAQQTASQGLPSIISVEVIGYGGGSGEDERKRNEPGE